METIAVYWESMIRTYGFEVRPNLLLARILLGGEEPDALEALSGDAGTRDLTMTTAHRNPDGDVLLDVVAGGVLAQALQARSEQPAGGVRTLSEVDVVFLHGPHYGDRYGIASAAMTALGRGGVDVLLASCAGASIFLAVAAGRADAAVAALKEAFVVPGAADDAGSPNR